MKITRNTALLFGAMALATPALHAGEGEVFCNTFGTEITEQWASIPAGGLQWDVYTGPASLRQVPGFPALFCPLPNGSMELRDIPGFQSLIRAAETWSNIEVPGSPGTPLSTFEMTSDPSFAGGGLFGPHSVVWVGTTGLNSINNVTFWEPDGFAPFGGSAAIAAAFVALDGAGNIIECDIAFQARTLVGGAPAWSFVEFNDAHQAWLASTPLDLSATSFVDPVNGYAEIQGVMTHEIGHFAGVAHSLIDSAHNPSGSLFPAMFPYAQGEPFAETMDIYMDCTFVGPFVADATTSLAGGMLGRSAQVLQADDISGIGSIYPASGFTSVHGSISGTVSTLSGTTLTLENGMHVVAQSVTQPDVVRVGAITKGAGSYSIQGLPPDDYYVYLEFVDQGSAASGAYFDTFVVPNYVFTGVSGCDAGVPVTTEFWNSGDAADELPMIADVVTVGTGGAVTGIDFVTRIGQGDQLVACNSLGQCNARGQIIVPPPGVDPSAELQVLTGGSDLVVLTIGTGRQHLPYAGQLIQVPIAPPGNLLVQSLPGTGTRSFPITVANNLGFNNFFAQAVIFEAAGPRLTNVTNLFVTNP